MQTFLFFPIRVFVNFRRKKIVVLIGKFFGGIFSNLHKNFVTTMQNSPKKNCFQMSILNLTLKYHK